VTTDNESERHVILVVDDEVEVRHAIVRILERRFAEYEIDEADDGDQALARLTPDVRLVISDVNMPRMDGFAFCRVLRTDARYAAWVRLPVILLTARDTGDDLYESWQAGSTLHVPKPFDPKRLEQAIRWVFDR